MPSATVTEKHCKRCGETKPASSFRPNPKLRYGLHSWCRPCEAEYKTRYNAARRKPREQHVCPGCGTAFSAVRSDHVYCTKRCVGRPNGDRAAAQRRRQERLDSDPAYLERKRARARDYEARVRERMSVDRELRARRVAQKRASDDRRLRQLARQPGAVTAATCARLRAEAESCATCGRELVHDMPGLREPTIDHIIPLAVGGLHQLANIRVVCRRCNVRRPRDGRDLVAA